jgi:hypothetical protein
MADTTGRGVDRRAVLLAAAAGVAFGSPSAAQGGGSPFVGEWGGVLGAGSQRLRLRLRVEQAADGLAATLYSLDQGGTPISAGETTADGDRLRVQFPAISGTLDVGLSGDGGLAGTWRQGATMPLALDRDGTDASFEGEWNGALEAGPQRLRVRVVVEGSANGLAATFYSLDQGGAPIPGSDVVADGDRLRAQVLTIGGELDVRKVSESRVEGTFTQGATQPIELHRNPDFDALGEH